MRNAKGQFVKGNPPSKGSFKKGHVPWSKNKKGICFNSGRTHFKKGQTGKKCINWKGGKKISRGYVSLYSPEHPFCTNQGYIRRSRLVMEKHLGRYLTPEEIVHHKGIKYPIGSIKNIQDDRIENLKLFQNRSIHTKFHRKLK